VLDLSTLPNTTGSDEGIHDQVRDVLATGQFGAVTAIDGYLVLQRGAPKVQLPEAFFSFARAGSPKIQHPLTARFGDSLELLGFDVLPGRDGRSELRAYWRAIRPIAADLFLPFFITDGRGREVGAALHRQPANVWYPTNYWQPGEVVQITTYDLPIGRRGQDFGIALGAQPGTDAFDTSGRLRPIVLNAPAPLRTPGQGALLEVITFHNDRDILTAETAPLQSSIAPERLLNVSFGEGIGLAGYRIGPPKPGSLGVTLFWTASGATSVPYTVFAHVLDRDGKLVGQRDAPPADGLKATTAWIKGETVVDEREIPVLSEINADTTHLEVGLYDPTTGRRLTAENDGRTVDHVELMP
jgi:hypothetical protein